MSRKIGPKESKEMAELLIAAEDEITPFLRSHDKKIVKDERGDVELAVESKYPIKLGNFLNRRGIYATIVSEGELIEKFEKADKNNYILFLDPFEGSTNYYYSGLLPYGVNMAMFPDKDGDIIVDDWITSIVTDRKNSIKYGAHRGNPDKAFVIENGKKRSPDRKRKSPIIEIPAGYADKKPALRQFKYYLRIMKVLGTNQYRSVDATGTMSASLVDGRIRVYIEGRKLKKLGGAWNLIPSAIIVNAGGGKATHFDGREFRKDVVFNREKYPQGFNPDVGRDFLGVNDPADYEACYKAVNPWYLRTIGYSGKMLRKVA